MAVHLDGRTLFVSARRITFLLDAKSVEWTCQDRETVGASRTVLHQSANTDQTLDASSNRTPNDDHANEDEGMPEVMSTPQQPTTMMRFDTLEDAEKHYKMYARQKGFGVRYCFIKKSEASGELIRASLVCHRAGPKIKKKVDTPNPQPIALERWRNTTERTNCPTRMFVKRRDNSWVVTEINDDHNHPLIKKWSLTGYLRSHRHIPEEEEQFVKLLD
ncbi:protein FAR1-RELATED SEQUENCE 5-like [Hordeum vulgare]|nr:protein FAR1-RELATED SEQUENCE 5-like [Hordeum vulgare]